MGFKEGKRFEANEYPIVICNFQSAPSLWVSDPDIVQDIFVGKNAFLDKHPEGYMQFKHVVGQSFIF